MRTATAETRKALGAALGNGVVSRLQLMYNIDVTPITEMDCKSRFVYYCNRIPRPKSVVIGVSSGSPGAGCLLHTIMETPNVRPSQKPHFV